MKIAIGSDHAGYELKVHLVDQIRALGHEVIDFGSYNPDPVDFPDIAKLICRSILSGESERGIMFCGTGVGAAIACNKIKGIRASVCHDVHSAHQSVEHDDVNVMALGHQIIGHVVAIELIELFLNATFSTNPDFRRRVEKLDLLEQEFNNN